LAEIKDLVRKAYIRITAEDQARQAARNLLKQVKTPGDLDKVAAQNHFTVAHTGDIPRANPQIPGIGEVPGLMAAAVALPQLPGLIDRVMESDGNSFVFEVSSLAPADPAEWKLLGPSFTQHFLEQRRQAVWVDFVNGLKSSADIVVHSELVGVSQS
jgi:hypothetical protein